MAEKSKTQAKPRPKASTAQQDARSALQMSMDRRY